MVSLIPKIKRLVVVGGLLVTLAADGSPPNVVAVMFRATPSITFSFIHLMQEVL